MEEVELKNRNNIRDFYLSLSRTRRRVFRLALEKKAYIGTALNRKINVKDSVGFTPQQIVQVTEIIKDLYKFDVTEEFFTSHKIKQDEKAT